MPETAPALQARAVGLVVARLEDVARAELGAGLGHPLGDHQRVLEALELAGSGDHRQGQVVAQDNGPGQARPDREALHRHRLSRPRQELTCSRRIETVMEISR
jgi:hypothetical protein